VDKARASTMVTTTIIIILAAGLVFSIGAASNVGMQSQATAQQQSEEIYRIQETAMSSAAPVAHTGNLPHAVVFALPIRDDGKIYTGQVTFTASKPIEVEVIHIYRPDQLPDEAHGQPPTAVINGTTITYSHLTSIVDNNIITGDVPTASGTFEFTGSGLVFHKRSSEPFTVTYTIDATVDQLTQ
jgi:type II secretory pathway pseudopilin PulG